MGNTLPCLPFFRKENCDETVRVGGSALGFVGKYRAGTGKKLPQRNKQPGANSAREKQAYLGVQLEPLPRPWRASCRGSVPKGQGILVLHVAKDSPAAKAGLQPHDIVTSYNEHKLSSPEQLVKLVRADKPGHEVTLGFVPQRQDRDGQGRGSGNARPSAPPKDHGSSACARTSDFQEMFEAESKNGSPAWEEFESMKLTAPGKQAPRAGNRLPQQGRQDGTQEI